LNYNENQKGIYIMGTIIKGLSGVTLVVAIILLIIFWPFAVIWAANTLFSFGIAYTFWTWLAVMVLTMTFGKTSVKKN
jgi:hypothetical protein